MKIYNTYLNVELLAVRMAYGGLPFPISDVV